MDKKQQIEEMARVACEYFGYYMVDKPCKKCKIYDKHCYTIHKAEILYNAGYRKIDENCAVITKGELKQYKVQAVREFAEKVKMAFFYEFDEIIPSIMSDKIDELLKEYK